MSGSEEVLPESLELALSHVIHTRGEAFAADIRPILLENLKRKRIGDLPGYVYHVADNYLTLHGHLYALQVVRSDQVWEPLLPRLQAWAYVSLGRSSLDTGTRYHYSCDCADEAAVEMMTAHFPYDVEFDVWARRCIHHVCRRLLSSLHREGLFQAATQDEWEEYVEGESGESGVQAHHMEFSFGLREEVSAALYLLPDRLEQVIRLIYFEALSFAEVATLLRLPLGTVYKRHHDARKRLAKILSF